MGCSQYPDGGPIFRQPMTDTFNRLKISFADRYEIESELGHIGMARRSR